VLGWFYLSRRYAPDIQGAFTEDGCLIGAGIKVGAAVVGEGGERSITACICQAAGYVCALGEVRAGDESAKAFLAIHQQAIFASWAFLAGVLRNALSFRDAFQRRTELQ